jgi:hypothetical protein
MAETRKAAEAALDAFIETYGIKYEKAVAGAVLFSEIRFSEAIGFCATMDPN